MSDNPKPLPEPGPDRDREMSRLNRNGMKQKDIGALFGVPQRSVSYAIRRHQRRGGEAP